MKKITAALIIIIVLVGCNSDSNSEALLSKEEDADKVKSEDDIKLSENRIVFGDKVDGKVKLNNKFKLGESTYFVILLKEPLEVKQVTLQLNKLVNKEWEKLTESKLKIKPSSKEIMNGIPGKIYEQTGPGSYEIIVKKNDEKVTSGKFIVKKG